MRLIITIIFMVIIIVLTVIIVPAQSYHVKKYGKLHDKPATYHTHTRGYKNVEFIRKLKQRKQYRQHRRNVRRGESKLKPSPLYFENQ